MKGGLQGFVDRLEQQGELARISVPVSLELEIAEIADRIAKRGDGKALLFENTGTRFPLLINMFGSSRRMAMALGVDELDAIPAGIEKLFATLAAPRPSFGSKLAALPTLLRLSRIVPRRKTGHGTCQQMVLRGDDARLSLLPALKCWPHDGGRFITLPLVHTLDPDTGSTNVGMYRMQIFDDHTAGLHWHIHKTGERHYQAWKRRWEEASGERGQSAGSASESVRQGRSDRRPAPATTRMPVSVALGGDPVYTYAATAPMPDGMDEYLLAGYLRGRAVRLVKCLTNDIRVPEDCDIVIEGYVDTAEPKRTEGPFGDHTGFYSLEDPYPVMHVTAITHRRGAIYPATIVGVPPMEDLYMARATEKIFLAPIRLALQPEVRGLWMPAPGVAHNLAVVSIERTYSGQAFKTAGALWGAGQMMFNKIMIVTYGPADDVDALAAGLRAAQLPDGAATARGTLDVLDHATATPCQGGKLVLDLTARRPPRPLRLPATARPTHGIKTVDVSLAEKWGVMILFAQPGTMVDVEAFIAANAIEGINFFVVVDTAARGLDHSELLWFALGNCEVGRDVKFVGGYLIADARTKLPGTAGAPARWPNVVTSLPETIALVDRRWAEYGLGEVGKMPASPSLRYHPLVRSEKAEI